MLPAIVSGIVTGDAPVSYRSIFFPSLVTYPEVFAKVNPTQFPRSTVVNFLRTCFMIFQRLKRYRCIEAINEAVARKSYSTGNRLVCFVFFSFSKLVKKGILSGLLNTCVLLGQYPWKKGWVVLNLSWQRTLMWQSCNLKNGDAQNTRYQHSSTSANTSKFCSIRKSF